MIPLGRLPSPRVLTILIVLSLLGGCGESENAYVPPPPPEVTVATPVVRSVTPILQENGVIEAVEEAEVRARVRGFVQQIEFEPGQRVRSGDVLYRIEPDLYQVSVNSAQASVKAAEAAESVAEAMVKVAAAETKAATQNLARQQTLMEKGSGSRADLDAAIAANDSAAAALESAAANLEAAKAEKGKSVADLAQAQLDLDYTTVRSPIDGRITATEVKVGNLVENGDRLALVVDRSEVFVNFSVSDRRLLEFMKARRAQLKPDEAYQEPDWTEYRVLLKRELDEGFPFEGVLDYVGQEGVDVATGTLPMRSRHANPDDQLYPGLFVTVRVPRATASEAALLPEYAVLRDQRGRYVLTVDAEDKVQRTSVSVGETISGWTVINAGITPDTRVVIDGVQRARPGLPVTPTEETLTLDTESLMRGFAPMPAAEDTPIGDDSMAPTGPATDGEPTPSAAN